MGLFTFCKNFVQKNRWFKFLVTSLQALNRKAKLYLESFRNMVANSVFAIVTTIWRPGFKMSGAIYSLKSILMRIKASVWKWFKLQEQRRTTTFFHRARRYLVALNQNIGILRMTGEVTDRFNEVTLFEFWQKAIEFFRKFMIHFLTCRVDRLFNSEFYCLAKSNWILYKTVTKFIFSQTE